MIVAALYRGPFDGERLVLPTDEPWPAYVVPQFGVITREWFYLLAGQLDEALWSYLFDDSFATIAAPAPPP